LQHLLLILGGKVSSDFRQIVLGVFNRYMAGDRSMITEIKAHDQVVTDKYAIYQGDSCDLIRAIPGDSIHFGIHSPPFEGLYKFSNYDRDISNNEGESFWEHYGYLISELFRVTKPGRIHAVHCMQLPTSKTRHGFIGMRDFRGEIVRAYEDAGWIFHSEICIWKDPVIAQQRTKSIRLLHKQITKDSCISGQGLADYVVTFRKPGDNEVQIKPECDNDTWIEWARPVWYGIREMDTLNPGSGAEDADDRHICPLQLDLIERAVRLWSNPGELVCSPFAGIGSEGHVALLAKRRFIGCELKASYWQTAAKNLADAEAQASAPTLFDEVPG
jgi:hypothetical protein